MSVCNLDADLSELSMARGIQSNHSGFQSQDGPTTIVMGEDHLTASERRGGRVFRNLRNPRRDITGVVRSDDRPCSKIQSYDPVGPGVSEGSPAEDSPRSYIATSAKKDSRCDPLAGLNHIR